MTKSKVFLPLDFEYNDDTDLRLIETVKKFPQLYDKRVALFKSPSAKKEAWKKVANLAETPLDFAIKRWDVLRRSYNKYRKSTSADELDSRPKYIKAMDFIKEFICSRLSRKRKNSLHNVKDLSSNSNAFSSEDGDFLHETSADATIQIKEDEVVKRKIDEISDSDADNPEENVNTKPKAVVNNSENEDSGDKADAMSKVLAHLLRDVKDKKLQNKKFLEAMLIIMESDDED